MYIVAIAWIYVVLMMSITENSIIAGIMTFVFYGLAPLALFLWIFGTPGRRRAAHRREQLAQAEASASDSVDQMVNQDDAADAGRNEHDLLDGCGKLGSTVQSGDQVGDGNIDHAGRGDAQQVGHRP